MISDEQAKQLKEHFIGQLTNFPGDKREVIKKRIVEMSNSELEEFMKQNQLGEGGNEGKNSGSGEGGKCIFCSISAGEVPSYKIDDNKESLAVLELNPLSRGHVLIVPKFHGSSEKIPSSAFSLAKKIAKKIKLKFKPAEIKISSISVMGHSLVEVLPLYGDEKERKKATEEELLSLKKELEFIKKPKIVKLDSEGKAVVKKKIGSNLPILKPRIP